MRDGCLASVSRCFIILPFLCFAVALPSAAMADSQFGSSEAIWKLMDTCTFEAQKAYPDYTHEGRLQRDAYRESCMRSYNLPYEGTGGSGPPGFAAQLQQNAQPEQTQQQIQQLLQQQMLGRAQR